MGEQRPMFRFRLPWMHSSAPPPPTPVATQSPPRAEVPLTTSQHQTSIKPNDNPTMPAQRPFRLQSIVPPQPPPPTQPTIEGQSPGERITITSVLTIPPQAPPSWSTKISAAQDTLRHAEVSPETKSQSQNSYQPASPSRTHSQIASRLPSPQFSATSQLPSPSLTSPQFSATSQLPSPRISANSSQLPSPKSSPQPSSPWHTSTQARDASQPSSTHHPQFQKSSEAETFHQPRSPSQLNSQSSGQTSPITSSSSLNDTKVQPTERAETRLPSASKMLTGIESPQPSASSNKTLSPVSVKPNVAVRPVTQPQSLEEQSKTEITPSVPYDSSTKATIRTAGTASKPPELSGPSAPTAPPGIAKDIPPHKLRSDDTLIASFPESLRNTYANTGETKKEIEMVQNSTLVADEEPKQKTMAVLSNESSGSLTHNKEKLKVAFQAEQRQLTNQDMVRGKEVATASKQRSLDGKRTKTMLLQQTDNKSTVSESRKKLRSSNGDRVSFQDEIRSDISKLADKMAIAHRADSKDEKISVVALLGKNKGASMQLGFDSVKRGGEFKIQSANKTEPVEGVNPNAGNIGAKRRSSKDETNKEDQMTKALINNNVQDINNSILMNSCITERNPGVHLALYYDPTEPIMSYDKKGSPEAPKSKSTLPFPVSLPTSPPPEGDP